MANPCTFKCDLFKFLSSQTSQIQMSLKDLYQTKLCYMAPLNLHVANGDYDFNKETIVLLPEQYNGETMRRNQSAINFNHGQIEWKKGSL